MDEEENMGLHQQRDVMNDAVLTLELSNLEKNGQQHPRDSEWRVRTFAPTILQMTAVHGKVVKATTAPTGKSPKG